MSKKLTYFGVIGLGEYIRYMLHYGGEKFEDIRHDYNSWPVKEVKNALPYGQLPLYEEGDRKLNQSIAIGRYIASQTGLLPSNPWEQAVLDATVFNITDFRLKLTPFFSEQDATKKEQIKKDFLGQSVEYYMSRFESELKANNGYFIGKLSWADFFLVGTIEIVNQFTGSEIEKNYPTIAALLNSIQSLPGVKEYIANRKPYVV